MALYSVHVVLDMTYDDIEADSPDEAFDIATDAAISGGDWGGDVQLIADDDAMYDDQEYDYEDDEDDDDDDYEEDDENMEADFSGGIGW